jgi:hypothetical protein
MKVSGIKTCTVPERDYAIELAVFLGDGPGDVKKYIARRLDYFPTAKATAIVLREIADILDKEDL